MTLALPQQAGRGRAVKVPTWTEITSFIGYILAGVFAIWVAIINARSSYGAKLIDRVTAVENREQSLEERLTAARESLLTAKSELLQARFDLQASQHENENLRTENAELRLENATLREGIADNARKLRELGEKYDLLQRNYQMKFPDNKDGIIGLPPG